MITDDDVRAWKAQAEAGKGGHFPEMDRRVLALIEEVETLRESLSVYRGCHAPAPPFEAIVVTRTPEAVCPPLHALIETPSGDRWIMGPFAAEKVVVWVRERMDWSAILEGEQANKFTAPLLAGTLGAVDRDMEDLEKSPESSCNPPG